jgi:hypothetical protein
MHVFYLANQFRNRHKALEFQKLMEYYHHLKLLNPFYDLQREDIEKIDEMERQGKKCYPDYDDDKAKTIVYGDLSAIPQTDGIVCILFDRDALGSYMEMFYAAYMLKLPVYLICYDEYVQCHLWPRVLCHKIFKSIEEFEDYVERNPGEMK